MHVLFPHTLHHPRTSSLLTIEPQDSQHTRFILSLFQLLDKACGTEHLVVEQSQALVAAELSAFHAFPAQVLQSDGMSTVSTNKSELHRITMKKIAYSVR
jgi:hypothetical protein